MATEASITQTGQVLGTAAYLAPEQAMGEPAIAASDRYALAVVAFELLTGEKPFQAEHFAAQARALAGLDGRRYAITIDPATGSNGTSSPVKVSCWSAFARAFPGAIKTRLSRNMVFKRKMICGVNQALGN